MISQENNIAKRHYRKCQIPNYVPHSTPENTNYETWKDAYFQQLIDIHEITKDIMRNQFPKNKIKWDETTFDNLSKVIYKCSSKHISPYL
jgi:hypothetical protein